MKKTINLYVFGCSLVNCTASVEVREDKLPSGWLAIELHGGGGAVSAYHLCPEHHRAFWAFINQDKP